MFTQIRTLINRWFHTANTTPGTAETPAAQNQPQNQPQHSTQLSEQTEQTRSQHVPYDENLLERSRTQWQFGDWQSLAQLNRDTLQHHPDRAKLALLAAAGRLQTDNTSEAKQYIRLAQDWGCSKKLITQILAAGVHNSLGRAAAVSGQQPRALQHFEAAIQAGTPGADRRLITQARIHEQFSQLGLPAAMNASNTSPAPTLLAH